MIGFETPMLLVDEEKVHRNMTRMIDAARARGKSLRPHTKTHKSSYWARRQMASGAEGIMVAKLSEAAVMHQGGMDVQSIGYPLIGESKKFQLRNLVLEGVKVRVSVDSMDGLALMKEVYEETGVTLGALIEVDTGMHRCGLENTEDIRGLATLIQSTPGVDYLGLTCFGGHLAHAGDRDDIVAAIREENFRLRDLRHTLDRAGLHPEVISEGGTIPAAFLDELTVATEIRPGTYIYNDVATVESFACTWEDCALTVCATVVSRPHPSRAIIDAGSKTLALDAVSSGGFGRIVEFPNLVLSRLSEEHGILEMADGSAVPVKIGDQVSIIPNHVCTTVNLHSAALLTKGGAVVGEIAMDARGMVQ